MAMKEDEEEEEEGALGGMEAEFDCIASELDKIIASSRSGGSVSLAPVAPPVLSRPVPQVPIIQTQPISPRIPAPITSPILPSACDAFEEEQGSSERLGSMFDAFTVRAQLSDVVSSLRTESSNLLAVPLWTHTHTARELDLFSALTSEKGAVVVEINAGEVLKIPFVLKPGQSITWQIGVKHFDVEFRMLLRKAASGGAIEKAVKIVTCVAGKVISGGMLPSNSPNPRHISIVLDNSVSRFRPKSVCYIVSVGTDMVMNVDVDEPRQGDSFITGIDEDEAYDLPSHNSTEGLGPAAKAQQALMALGSRALRLARQFQLHDADPSLESGLDSVNDDDDPLIPPVVGEVLQETLSQLGSGLKSLAASVASTAKRFQLHDDPTVTLQASASELRAPSVKVPRAAKIQPTDSDSDISTQWVSAERFGKTGGASPAPHHPQVSVGDTGAPPRANVPLLLNRHRLIDAETYQALWTTLEHAAPDLTLGSAVCTIVPDSEPTVLIRHFEDVGAQTVAQAVLPNGLRLFIHAEGLKLPITIPAQRSVALLAEVILLRSADGRYWLFSITARGSENLLEEFVLSLRLSEIFRPHDDGSRGRGRALALLGLDYY